MSTLSLEGYLDAERGQVSVLFTDLVGFTSFSERSAAGSGPYADAQPIEADGRSAPD